MAEKTKLSKAGDLDKAEMADHSDTEF